MTIFNVMQWPISIPPYGEELARLPDDLFNYWLEDIGYGNTIPVTPQQVAVYFEIDTTKRGTAHTRRDVELLRRMIAEWDTKP